MPYADPDRYKQYQREYHRAHNGKIRGHNLSREQRDSGLFCRDCKQPAVTGRKKCAFHIQKDRERSAKYRLGREKQNAEAAKLARAQAKAAGLCVWSGCDHPPIENQTLCEKHRGSNRRISLRHRFGVDGLDDLLSAATVCELCGLPFGNTAHSRKVVDHDHKSGVVRGIIHGSCNFGIGHFSDDPALLEKAAAYLRARGK